MSGISPKLPLRRDNTDGYELNKTMIEAIEQNFKNLILTNPGERIMDINFGAGIRKYIFEQNDHLNFSRIGADIRNATEKYIPLISINDIRIINHSYNWTESNGPEPRPENANPVDDNEIQISIMYTIPAIGYTTVLDIAM